MERVDEDTEMVDADSHRPSGGQDSAPPPINENTDFGRRTLIRLWTDVVAFSRRVRRPTVLRICELCLNPASYVTGGYNKKKLKLKTLRTGMTLQSSEPALVRLSARLNCPRREAMSVVCDGVLYSLGGVWLAGAAHGGATLCLSDKWIAVNPMPKQRRGGASCSINGKVYVAGGYQDGVGALLNVYEYDPHYRAGGSAASQWRFAFMQVSCCCLFQCERPFL